MRLLWLFTFTFFAVANGYYALESSGPPNVVSLVVALVCAVEVGWDLAHLWEGD